MLVASRDPFHPGSHDAPQPSGSRFTRVMNALQIIGALLAVPVGIGSAVTMYRANFSVEATCQSLRGNIVAMLDRSVDAATRHMLVRRDVEAFESSCRAVDPDASAAFKALLSAEKAAAPVAAATVKRIEPKPETVARKAEPRPEKEDVAKVAAVKIEAAPLQRDATSDVVWVDAVRRALVTDAPAPVAAPNPVPVFAPALPPAMPISLAPAPRIDDGHPVPPESIPDAVSAPKTEKPARSRLGGLVSHIPLVGWAFDR
jgi:hypothetical protein